MTNAQLQNLGKYALAALVGALVTTGLQLGVVLSGTDDILIRPLLATFVTGFFGSLATALGASQFGRLGSEGISAQVKALQADGVPRSDMVVLSSDDAAHALNSHPHVETPKEKEAARLARIQPLRDLAAADEARERQARG